MRRTVVLLLVLVIVVMLVSYCQADSDYSGTWYTIKYEKSGQESDPSEKGYNQVLAFYPSGKALRMLESGKYVEGKWSDLNNYIMLHFNNEKSQLFSKEGDYLTQIDDGGTIWFKKEIDLQEPHDIIPNSEDDYYGIWKLERFSINGVLLSLKMAALSGTNASGKITITKDNAYLEMDLGKKPVTWDGKPTFSNGKVLFNKAEFTMTDTDELYLASEKTNYYFRKIKPEEGWFCIACGNLASGNYCNNCGQAFQSGEKEESIGALLRDESKDPGVKNLYLGEYVIGTDLQPGVYVLSATELEYDWLWEVNKAAIRTYEYVKSDRDWVKKDYESVNKKGQKIRLTLEMGQKIKVEAGTFEVADFTYRAPSEEEEEIPEEQLEIKNEPWFDHGVGSKLPKPIAVSGKVLKASSLATTNSDTSFYTTVSATKKDYEKYKETLRAWGFDKEIVEMDSVYVNTFEAKNGGGYKVSITFNAITGIIISASTSD